jgi:alpha-aminoadipic semialdehyde synthase
MIKGLNLSWTRFLHSSTTNTIDFSLPPDVLKVGIVRETITVWERRAPLTPSQIRYMLEEPTKPSKISPDFASVIKYEFHVQPSNQRIFSDEEYHSNGAIISDDLSDCDIILGVKRPREEKDLLPTKTYLFFAHVTKGQPENMALLHEILKRNIQLLDYEHMLNPCGRRLVSFGKFAGIAGTIHMFHMLGIQLMKKFGISTPFVAFPSSSTMFPNINSAKERLLQIGQDVKMNGIPGLKEPLVVAITGGPNGNVFQGILEILSLLPHEFVAVQDLPNLYQKEYGLRQNKLYICLANSEFIYQRFDANSLPELNKLSSTNKAHIGDSVFDREHFRNHPNAYRCSFSKLVLPYINIFINAMYYDARFPKLVTKHQIKNNDRLLLIADISCDINGAIEVGRLCLDCCNYLQLCKLTFFTISSKFSHILTKHLFAHKNIYFELK